MNIQEGLLGLCLLCERDSIGFELSYETGRYIPGELIDYEHPGEEPDPSTIRQGNSGWRVEIGGYSYTDDNGDERLYSTLKEVLEAGYGLLKEVKIK